MNTQDTLKLALIFLATLVGLSSPAAEKMPVFPKVSVLVGQAQSERELGRPIKLKLKDVLIERALIKVGAKSQLKLELNASSSLLIFENSVVEIPVITWGESDIPEIKLEKGKVFYECEKNCRRYLTTPLSREIFTNGESELEYVPESPRVELIIIHGNQDFKGLENEEVISVKAGQKAVFQGLKESGEVAYDYLLKGRKIARGKMQPLVTLTESEIKKLVKDFEVKREVSKAGAKPKRTALQICENPFAEFNQCTWSAAKNGKCQRRRCNANGGWADTQETTSSCQPQEKVGPCDY